MMKLKWWQILLIAILIVILVLIVYNSYSTPKAPSTAVLNPGVTNPTPQIVVVNRNTNDDNPNAIVASMTYEDPNALTDSNGTTALKVNDKYIVNGLQMIKCCHARSAVTCKCTGWTWKASGNCSDPGCGGGGGSI